MVVVHGLVYNIIKLYAEESVCPTAENRMAYGNNVSVARRSIPIVAYLHGVIITIALLFVERAPFGTC